jgi:hydroxymethylpyrimidine/phosphomethylpyrimidine kinase
VTTPPEKIVRVLIVAGSDSGGGAGIQADIKTATALGAYAMTAITAVTVQDTTGVHSFHAIPPKTVADQIRVVLDDMGADVVKTGMLVNARTVEAVAEALSHRRYKHIPIVVDTVMIAKGGANLVDDTGVDAMRSLLFPHAALITPNAPEAARLTGLTVETPDDLIRAAVALRGKGAGAVLVKGGHLPGETITDVLADFEGTHIFRTRRIGTAPVHGTGCTLATAIATGIAQRLSLLDAVSRARTYVQQAIESGFSFGHGAGLLNHLHPIPPYDD